MYIGGACADKRGRWVFRSSRQQCERRQPSYDCKCRRWIVTEKKQYNNARYFTRSLPPCPCFLWQAARDPRYYVDTSINCALLAFPVSSATAAQVQHTCSLYTVPAMCIHKHQRHSDQGGTC